MSDAELARHATDVRRNIITARERLAADTELPEEERAERSAALADLMGRATAARWTDAIPSRYLWAELDHFDATVTAPVLEWTDHPAGRNLVVLGAIGTGKTHLAIAAMRPIMDRGQDVMFSPLVELLDTLRPGGGDHAFEDLTHVDVLVLDDLGTERPTEWTAERVYALVNRRWLEERPTVATTNLALGELRAAVGPRIYSRLVGNDAVIVELAGGDRRQIKGGIAPPPSGRTMTNHKED